MRDIAASRDKDINRSVGLDLLDWNSKSSLDQSDKRCLILCFPLVKDIEKEAVTELIG